MWAGSGRKWAGVESAGRTSNAVNCDFARGKCNKLIRRRREVSLEFFACVHGGCAVRGEVVW